MYRLFVAFRVWKVSFSPPVWPTSGQIERLGVRMKQRCFSHRFSLFIGMLCLLICVVTLTAPTALASAAATSGVSTALAAPSASSSQPNFGPSVYIFNPSMPQSKIQATVDKVASAVNLRKAFIDFAVRSDGIAAADLRQNFFDWYRRQPGEVTC